MRLFAAALFIALTASGSMAQGTAAVRLRFNGLSAGGKVVVALFAEEARWRSRRGALRSAEAAVANGAAEAVFEGLPPGRYAVMAYHDRNANGRLDTLPIGLPTEPYGFSNDARGMFGPPSWSAAAFTAIAGEAMTQAIRLH